MESTKPNRIECIIYLRDLILTRPGMEQAFILAKLRESGIPVKGCLEFQGVLEGTLAKEHTPSDPFIKYIWTSDNENS